MHARSTQDMKTTITRRFTFEAAHQLPHHSGKCARLHGHSYTLEVTVGGALLTEGSSEGMIVDFADLSKVVEHEVINQWDHQYLNNIVPFRPTVELLVGEAFSRLQRAGLPLVRVVLFETAKSCATVEH